MPETVPQDNLPPEVFAFVFVILIGILAYRKIRAIVSHDYETHNETEQSNVSENPLL